MKFKLKTIGIAFATAVAVVSGLASCTSPSDKAGKIVKGMDENSSLLYVDTYGETPCVITYTPDDSVGNIVRHNLKEGKVDTLPQPFIYFRPCEIVPVKEGYLVISRFPKDEANEKYIYAACIVRNPFDKNTRSIAYVNVDDNAPNLYASGYVLDKESQKLTLSSYDGKSNGAVIYHTVYDFNGNKLNASPESYLAKQQTVAPAGSSGATYIWECQHCHEKRNSRTRPSEWEFTCHGRGERPGFGSSHKWVKIGQVY